MQFKLIYLLPGLLTLTTRALCRKHEIICQPDWPSETGNIGYERLNARDFWDGTRNITLPESMSEVR